MKMSPKNSCIIRQVFLFLLLQLPGKGETWSWTSPPLPLSQNAPRVSGHSVGTDYENQRILLFGGLTGSAGSPASNQLWSFEQDQWHLVAPENSDDNGPPGPRMYSASAILDGSMYLMGGWDPGAPKSGGIFLDEVWRLDLATLQWALMAEKLPSGPVSRHAACTVGAQVVMHTFRGVLKMTTEDGALSGWVEQATTGEGPEGLSMCAMVPLSEKSLLVFGGSTNKQQLSSDAFVLNTQTWEWTKLEIDDDDGFPAARASPCAAQYGENQCVVFGGACLGGDGYEGGAGLQAQNDAWLLTVVDEKKAQWELVQTDGDGPKARLAATLSPLPSSSSSNDGGLLLTGGWDPKGDTFCDTWILKR